MGGIVPVIGRDVEPALAVSRVMVLTAAMALLMDTA